MNEFENLNDGNASFENKRAIATTELDASHDQKPKAASAKLIESATDIMVFLTRLFNLHLYNSALCIKSKGFSQRIL